MRYRKIVGITLLSLITSSAEVLAGGRPVDITEGVYGYVRDEAGSPIANVNISLFDGFTLHTGKTGSMGEYRISKLPVSKDLYAVIFFTKEGLLPKAVNLKAGEIKAIEYSTKMKRIGGGNIGFVTGTVYQPMRGGKIQFQSGIYGFGRNTKVWLEGVGGMIEMETDHDGHFLFEIPPGRYTLSGEGVRGKVEVEVSAGESVIGNLRSGLVLVD